MAGLQRVLVKSVSFEDAAELPPTASPEKSEAAHVEPVPLAAPPSASPVVMSVVPEPTDVLSLLEKLGTSPSPPAPPPPKSTRNVGTQTGLASNTVEFWSEMTCFHAFMRFVAARQQYGIVAAFESQLTQEETNGVHAPQMYHRY